MGNADSVPMNRNGESYPADDGVGGSNQTRCPQAQALRLGVLGWDLFPLGQKGLVNYLTCLYASSRIEIQLLGVMLLDILAPQCGQGGVSFRRRKCLGLRFLGMKRGKRSRMF